MLLGSDTRDERIVERAPASVHEQKPKRRVETDHDAIMRFFGQGPAPRQIHGEPGRTPRVPVGTAVNPN